MAALIALMVFSEHSIFSLASRDLIVLFAAYYAIDPLIWGAITWRSKRVRTALPTAEHLRIGQIIVAAMLFVVFAYDSGQREAANQKVVEVCEGPTLAESSRIMLQRVGDLVICAKVDWEKKWVYADFTYANRCGKAGPFPQDDVRRKVCRSAA